MYHLCILFITFALAIAVAFGQAQCPAGLQRIGTTEFDVSLPGGAGEVDISMCKPLAGICISSDVCTTPNCCSVCEKWCNDPANGCGACLGKTLSVVLVSARTISLLYIGGDPVVGEPPFNGPRQVWVNVTFNASAGELSNVVFTDPGSIKPPPERKDGDPWTYQIRAQSSQIRLFSCSTLTDCESCTSSSCAWCYDSKSCIDSSKAGQQCSNWVASPDLCPSGQCKSYTDCKHCLAPFTPNCAWCFGASRTSCVPNAFAKPDLCSKGSFNQSKYCP